MTPTGMPQAPGPPRQSTERMSIPRGPDGRGLRLGLAGAGRWGMAHIHSILSVSPSLLTAVFDPSEEARSAAGKLAPEARLAPAFDVDLAASLDGLIIATPTATHPRIARSALDVGIHVLLEKPVATRLEDAVRVRDAASASSATCLIGHQMLHHPAVEHLVGAITAGMIGRPRLLTAVRTSKPRPGDDPLWALGPHDLALALVIAGRAPERVDARRTISRTDVVLEFDSDFCAKLSFQRTPNGIERGPRTTRVVGDAATLVLDEATGQLSLESHGNLRPLFSAPAPDPLRLQLHHFLECMQGHALPRSTASAAALAVAILEQASQIVDERPGARAPLTLG